MTSTNTTHGVGVLDTATFMKQSTDTMKSTQAEFVRSTQKITSGQKAASFDELISETGVTPYLSDLSKETIIHGRQKASVALKQVLAETEYSVRTMLDINKEAKVIWNTGYGNAANQKVIDMTEIITPMISTIEGLLNKQFNGKYLFSGNRSNTQSASITSSNIVAGDITANYYQGDEQNRKEKISEGNILEYGIRADHEAFKNMVGALYYMLDGASALKANNFTAADSAFSSAHSLLSESQIGLQNLLQDSGNYTKILERQIALDEDETIRVQERIGEAVNTDIINSMLEVSALQAKLTASYQIIIRSLSQSLVNEL